MRIRTRIRNIIEKLRNIFHKLKFSNGQHLNETPSINKMPLKLGSYYLYLKNIYFRTESPENDHPYIVHGAQLSKLSYDFNWMNI